MALAEVVLAVLGALNLLVLTSAGLYCAAVEVRQRRHRREVGADLACVIRPYSWPGYKPDQGGDAA